MSKRSLYIFSLWIATVSVLLSTVMSHHHHSDRICMVMELCHEDGNYNDEHTHHHENEREGCRVHQMHHFFTNAKIVKSIERHIFDGARCLVATFATNDFSIVNECSQVAVDWQHQATPLHEAFASCLSRRGPPSFIFRQV